MKRILLLITVYIVVIAYVKGQTFSFVTYTTGKEEGSVIEYDFKIEIDKKNIKEQPGGIFNIDLPYYKTYFTNDFISFGLKEGSVLPKGITEYDRCSHFFAISKVTGVMTLKFDNNDNKYEFVPKEFLLNDQKDLPGLLNRIENLKKSLSGNSKSSSTTTTPSANSSVKAVFHGTRVGKVYHLPEDSRDDYDLFFQCNVTVYNIKGQQVQLTAYVDGPTRGKGLYAPSGRHKTSEGNVAIGGVLNSRTDSDNTRWPHYTLTLPFSDLCLPDGTHTINVRWFAQAQGKFIGNSEFQTIHFTKQGKEITNFYVDGGEETPGF